MALLLRPRQNSLWPCLLQISLLQEPNREGPAGARCTQKQTRPGSTRRAWECCAPAGAHPPRLFSTLLYLLPLQPVSAYLHDLLQLAGQLLCPTLAPVPVYNTKKCHEVHTKQIILDAIYSITLQPASWHRSPHLHSVGRDCSLCAGSAACAWPLPRERRRRALRAPLWPNSVRPPLTVGLLEPHFGESSLTRFANHVFKMHASQGHGQAPEKLLPSTAGITDLFESAALIPASSGFDHTSAQKDTAHFPRIGDETGVRYERMLFFDDEHKNVARVRPPGRWYL